MQARPKGPVSKSPWCWKKRNRSGGFTGISVSEPLLQGGILVSVVGYMFVLQPWFALLGLAFFLSQTVFVPLLQSAINRRAQASSMTRGEIW